VVDLGGLVRDTARMLERLIGEDVELRTVVARDAGRVRADPGQIEQVLVNLVVNARDAMPGGGVVTLEVHNRSLDAPQAEALGAAPGPYLVLSVSDTGIGMDTATRGQIFEPFFTTKDKGKGTGLGLSVVYGIVTQSGGQIAVDSAPGAGSTFRVYLPRVEDLPTGAGEPERRDSVGGSETVLLVEDDGAVRRLAREILERGGYTVLDRGGSAEGLTAGEGYLGEIHLLLTDIVMPGMNGRELAEELRRRRPSLRVLYMSGYAAEVIADHGLLGAGTALIEKPFTADMLLRKVRSALDG
jgi:CheY-like chemotaxis protein